MQLEKWLETYRRIWMEHEYSPEIIRQLFTEDVIYRPNIIQEIEKSHYGHDAILAYLDYWIRKLRWEFMEFGEPIVSGSRVLVEVWLYGLIDNEKTTEVIGNVLTFDDDGRCKEVRDYVQFVTGVLEPPFDGWK